MPTKEIRDAWQLITEIDVPAEQPRWAWWTPGDATRYHVTLINAAPSSSTMGNGLCGTFRALAVTVESFGPRPITIVIPRPSDEDDRYTAAEWVYRAFPGGWWAGVRPLLAALGWTPETDRDTRYRSTDHREIAKAQQTFIRTTRMRGVGPGDGGLPTVCASR